ncbi:hypothetical protein ACFHYO_15720 [Paracoccus panacisoli]|uniref:Mobilization protein n=1 Tax=Paracoccus panacisoli TaxID=1510163 RepID=A0ABV6T8F3_9RHOB
MARNIEAQIAEAQNRLNKLKDRAKANENRGRYILATLVLGAAKTDPRLASNLATVLRNGLKTDRDRASCATILADLDAAAHEATHQQRSAELAVPAPRPAYTASTDPPR